MSLSLTMLSLPNSLTHCLSHTYTHILTLYLSLTHSLQYYVPDHLKILEAIKETVNF